MKLAILTFGDRQSASTRYRILNFMPWLNRDFDAVKIVYYKGLTRPLKQWHKFVYVFQALKAARNSDIVLIQKILLPSWLLKRLANSTQRIVFDFDDAIWLDGPQVPVASPRQLRSEGKLRSVLQQVDHVIAGNEFLADYAKKYARSISVIPTVVDSERYTPHEDKHKNRVCLGWIGSQVNFPYLASLEPVFQQLHDRYPGRLYLKVISDGRFATKSGLECLNVPWSEKTEIAEMGEFDIGLMPLADTQWARGKCAFKAIQYMALGIVPAVSPIGANTQVVTNGQNGMWANSQAEWVAAISRLIQDPDYRNLMGQAARERALSQYTLNTAYPRLRQVLIEMNHIPSTQ
ncbi:MAG: glycosyltransferase family 4 protein [bacterium]|nr:glycosyltransferase family 4 protein [bacterium]